MAQRIVHDHSGMVQRVAQSFMDMIPKQAQTYRWLLEVADIADWKLAVHLLLDHVLMVRVSFAYLLMDTDIVATNADWN